MTRWNPAIFSSAILALAVGCGPQKIKDEGDPVDGGFQPIESQGDLGDGAALTVGGKARVTASWLNLRQAAGTDAAVLVAMPCGSTVSVVGGPSTMPTGWWNVTYEQNSGWASGKYLVAEADFDASICPTDQPTPMPDGGAVISDDAVTAIFDRAKLAVGYSYYWGHGSWRTDGATRGSCNGYCPDCVHTGQYGADCSGFVAKAWQVPNPTPLEKDTHPYSTYNFFFETNREWRQVPRSELKPGDALVRRSGGSGHIVLVEDGSDPFGDLWLYEARACMIGIVHNLRSVDSSYIAIRRNDLP